MVRDQSIGSLTNSGARCLWPIAAAIAGMLSWTTGAIAQIIPDSSLGAESSSVTPNVSSAGGALDRIDGGAIRGSNLFHSFQEFNVSNLQRVYFANPSGIENILGRVTGNRVSEVLGTLGVLGNANLYFINPNGIIFGQDARLDISGSFFAGTARSLMLENGYEFGTVNPDAPPLLSVNIRPGLQMGLLPQGAIANSGNLSVGQNLTLVGNNLNLEGQLQAGGNLTLQAADTLRVRDSATKPFIASAMAQLFVRGNKIDIFALNHSRSGFFSGADMVFRSANAIGGNAQFSSGGDFLIEQMNGDRGDLSSTDDPIIRASGDVSFNSYEGPSLHIFAGGSVTIDSILITGPDTANFIDETVTLSDGVTTLAINGSAEPTVDIRAGTTAFNPPGILGDTTGFSPPPSINGTGTSANITINSIITPGGLIFLSNQDRPNPALSGDITVSNLIAAVDGLGGGDVVIDSRGKIITPGTLDVSGFDFTIGTYTARGGNITLLANGDIFMPNPSKIFSYGTGGGNITLKSRSAIIQEQAPLFDSFIESAVFGSETGGDVTLEAPSIFLSNFVQSNTFAEGSGGAMRVTADSLTANGAIVLNFTRGGDAGKVTINAGAIALNESQIGSQTFSAIGGRAGDVEINAKTFVATGANPAVLSETQGVGDAGAIVMNTGFLSLREGAQIRGSTQGGNAGNIEIVADEIVLDGAVLLSIPGLPEPVPAVSAITSEVLPGASGRGGRINITTRRLSASNGAGISASTAGLGDAGNIIINASESVSFDGNPGAPFSPSGAFVGTLEGATGKGGMLTLNAPFLSVTNGAQLEALTENTQNAGQIAINAQSVFLSGADTGLFSNTTPGSTGNGGVVDIRIAFLTLQDGAQISASTAGQGNAGDTIVKAARIIFLSGAGTGIFSNTTPDSTGNGGSIFIDPDRVEIRDGAAISVDSQGSGTGGNIEIRADQLILDDRASISAETASTNGGDIALLLSDLLLLRRESRISTSAGMRERVAMAATLR
jgi:filamentous hemagglutinin family protein